MSRRSNNKSAYMGPVTHVHAIRMREKAITPSRSEEMHYASMFVDLTAETEEQELLPGAPFSTIKNCHKLYFMYDPRGSKDADSRYCPHCRCPKNYCAKIVMGDIVVYTVELHVKNVGILHHVFDGRGIEILFNKYHSKQVHQKMLENGKSYKAREAAQMKLDKESKAYFEAKYNSDMKFEM